jgi:hypothetical protein
MKATRIIAPLAIALAALAALYALLNPAPAKADTVYMFNTGLGGWSVTAPATWASGENSGGAGDSGGAASLGAGGSIARQFTLVQQSGTYKMVFHAKGQFPPQVYVAWDAGVGFAAGAMSMGAICQPAGSNGWSSCYAQFNSLPAAITTWKIEGVIGANYVDYVVEPTRLTSGSGPTPPPGGGDPGDPPPTATPAPTPAAQTGNYYDIAIQFIPGTGSIYYSMGNGSSGTGGSDCTVLPNSLECIRAGSQVAYWMMYGLQDVKTTYTTTAPIYGVWFDVSSVTSNNGLAGSREYGNVPGTTSRVCGLVSDRPGDIPGASSGHYAYVFDGVGCTHVLGGGALGLVTRALINQGNWTGYMPAGLGASAVSSFQITNLHVRSGDSGAPPAEPPPDLTKMYGAGCFANFTITDTLTTTQTITDPISGITSTVPVTSPITSTVTVTYGASLLADGSFEAADLWNQTTWQYAGAGYWDRIGPASQAGQYAWRYAQTGQYALWKTEYQDTGANTQLCQTIRIPEGTDFIRGGFNIIPGEGGSGSRTARLMFYQAFVSGSVSPPADPFSAQWQALDGDRAITQPTTAPACIEIGPGAASIYVDSVFIYAMQGTPEDPEIVCPPVPADLIPPGAGIGGPGNPTNPISPTNPLSPTIPIIPPLPGTGDPNIDLSSALCVQCITPASLNLHHWIGWLFCKLQNIVFCHLVIWYANILNYTAAGFNWGRAFIWWLGFLANYTLGWGWNVIEGLWLVILTSIQIFYPNLAALFGNVGGWFGVFLQTVEMAGGWSIGTIMEIVGWVGRFVLAGFSELTMFLVQRMVPWPLRFLWYWMQQAWPLIYEFFQWIGENLGGWLAWLIDNALALRAAIGTWIWNLLVNLGRAILESSILQTIWHALEFLWFSLGAVWELIKLWAVRLMLLGQAVVDFIMLMWSMALETVAALRADPFTTTEVFGHDTSTLSYSGQNETSILYLIMVGIFIADSLLNVTAVMVLLYVVMALMAWGLIRWTLVEFTNLLPVQ